ncbi:MAG: DegV family protein [Firmicutes bacterium]|nr:DegV family protein [Bacillota bacterium]
MAVKIVTDSTADIPSNLIAEYGIEVVPLNVHFGEEVFKDGVDIWSEEFYNKLRNEPLLPNTSQPSPGEFLKAYQKIAQPGDTIISIHISREMSGTADSAELAAQMAGADYQIRVVDSRNVSMGLGIIVLKAAKAAKNGETADSILAKLSEWKQEVSVYFTLKSLEYLHRTGRIGKASALLGGLLSIKPILQIEDGLIVPAEKIRGNYQKVAELMVEKLAERYGSRPLLAGIVHTELPGELEILKTAAQKRLNIDELVINLVGPIVGTHAGPYTIGIIALPV